MNRNVLVFIRKHNFISGFFLSAILIFVSFFLSLQLSLYGDDWLRLHILRYMFDTGQGMSYFSIWSYFGPYNSQYPILFLVRLLWGYNPVGYFLTSLIFRILGSISFYFPLKKITKSSLIGWVGATLIGTTPIGIQVTDWVFYMNTYISLIFLSMTFYLVLKIEESPSWKNQLLFFLFSLLFIFIIPVRSYGFFLTLVVLCLIKIIWQKKIKRKFAVVQLVGISIIYLTAKAVGSLGPTTDVINSIQVGISNSFLLLTHHNYSFILVPLINFGKIIFPDMLYLKLQTLSVRIFQPQIISLFIVFLLIGLGYYFWKNITKKRFLVWSFINIAIIPVVQIIFVLVNPADQMYAYLSFWLLFNSGYYLFYKKKAIPLLIFLLFIFCFSLPYYLLPWSFDPSVAFSSDHRYLYFPAIGVIITTVITLWLLTKKNELRKFVFIFLALAILINIVGDVIYFRGQLRFRSEQRQAKIFASLHETVPSLPRNKQAIFYITDTTGQRTDVYSFGFPFYMGLSYNISTQGMLPFILPSLDELHSAITDGASLKKYTQATKRVNLDDIYYLKLLPNDTFVQNKAEVLEQLKTYEK